MYSECLLPSRTWTWIQAVVEEFASDVVRVLHWGGERALGIFCIGVCFEHSRTGTSLVDLVAIFRGLEPQ